MSVADPTKRFSDRVENYIKYRPSYPVEIIGYLEKECSLNTGALIADIGSGTGIFTGLLLNQRYKVYAVEPNGAMQAAAIAQFGDNPLFKPVNGTAETTLLPPGSMDLIVCAQAFHWFNAHKTHIEFKRVLKENGRVALVWNNRDTNVDEFSKAYEGLLKNDSVDYNKVNHRNIKDIDFKAFFKDGVYQLVKYPNVQVFDEAGFLGRAYSSSYLPAEGTEAGIKFRGMLEDLFAKYNNNGKVSFTYQTEVYTGNV